MTNNDRAKVICASLRRLADRLERDEIGDNEAFVLLIVAEDGSTEIDIEGSYNTVGLALTVALSRLFDDDDEPERMN